MYNQVVLSSFFMRYAKFVNSSAMYYKLSPSQQAARKHESRSCYLYRACTDLTDMVRFRGKSEGLFIKGRIIGLPSKCKVYSFTLGDQYDFWQICAESAKEAYECACQIARSNWSSVEQIIDDYHCGAIERRNTQRFLTVFAEQFRDAMELENQPVIE